MYQREELIAIWRRRISKIIISILKILLFLGLSYVLIRPILFMLSTALKSREDLIDPTVVWIPKHLTFENFKLAFNSLNYFNAFKNSLLISIIPAIFNVISCSMIGYGLARFKFREKEFIFALILFTLIVPPQVLLIPLYVFYQRFDILGIISLIRGEPLNLLNTYYPIILPTILGGGLRSGLFIYIFRQFFRGMSQELEEAAYVDGASPFQTYVRIFIPNSIPAVVTVFLFSLVWHWNDVFEPSVYIGDFEKYTLSLNLANIKAIITGGTQIWDPLLILPPQYAGAILVILPMLIFYLFTQRFFVESIERTGIIG
ncbi:MAG TPA: carbohydrate ABC transporter permease [Dictyoglomaceae bacterium]|nr:carbohydrate ABC transporter permease [Dictyoglomaceae bacterium]HOL39477.1 carbohydrate ABC transporter permease [Dictyoglomaceae bacterium]HPP15382.1 carbohydrate ABC transporter permease [Dictyoglomaceae bacterium]HPU43663.1 carbohydrate ABC transporter permease [Dictyoglomaceae bacterium]